MDLRYLWLGHAVPVAQIDQANFGPSTSVDLTTVLTFTCNGKQITARIPSGESVGTGDQSTALLFQAAEAAINATTIPEFMEVIAAANTQSDPPSLSITTRDTWDGIDFNISVEATGTGAGDLEYETVQAATGPNWINDPDNWLNVDAETLGVLPDDGDECMVQIGSAAHSLRYGSLAGRKLKRFTLSQRFVGELGLRRINPDGGYPEYRNRFLDLEFGDYGQSIDNPNLIIGSDVVGTGSGLVRIRTRSADTVFGRIERTGSQIEDQYPAFMWTQITAGTGTGGSASRMEVLNGIAGFCLDDYSEGSLDKLIVRNGYATTGAGLNIGGGGIDLTGGTLRGQCLVGGVPVIFGG